VAFYKERTLSLADKFGESLLATCSGGEGNLDFNFLGARRASQTDIGIVKLISHILGDKALAVDTKVEVILGKVVADKEVGSTIRVSLFTITA
jgi:hypothetical protein